MKRLILSGTLALALLNPITSFADLELSNVGPWTIVISPGNKPRPEFGNATTVLNLYDKQGEVQATIIVKRLKSLAQAPSTLADWNREALSGMAYKPIVQTESLLKSEAGERYIAEFQMDVGTQNMMNGAIMATVADGELWALSYVQHRPIYQTHRQAVLELLRTIRLKGTN